MDDYKKVLAALIALKNNENDAFITKCKRAEQENRQKPQTPITAIYRLKLIWDEVFPQCKLRIDDSKFYAVLEKDGIEQAYSATQMSDGERSVLYLTAQVLCVPTNKTLITIVIGLLQGEKRADIIDAVAGYLPTEIPR